MDNSSGDKVKEGRPSSFVEVHYIKKAGHHLHVEQPEEFNGVINRACSMVDRNEDIAPALVQGRERTVSAAQE